MYRSTAAIVIGVMVGLCACATDPQEQKLMAIQKGMERCDGMGKQFLLRSAGQARSVIRNELQTVVEYACVGPGEEGYVPPS